MDCKLCRQKWACGREIKSSLWWDSKCMIKSGLLAIVLSWSRNGYLRWLCEKWKLDVINSLIIIHIMGLKETLTKKSLQWIGIRTRCFSYKWFLSYKNSVEHSNVTEKCPLSSLSVLSKLACYLKHCTIHLDFLGIGWLDMENGGKVGNRLLNVVEWCVYVLVICSAPYYRNGAI